MDGATPHSCLETASLPNLIKFKRFRGYFINVDFFFFFLGSPIPSSSPYPNPSFLGTPSQGTSFLCFILILLLVFLKS